MANRHRTALFGDYRIASAITGTSKYGHTFGGPHDRRGASRDDCNGILIHLLHRLDLTDPAVGIAIPGLRWLPLYYCFDDRAIDIGYRLISDDEMATYFPDDPRVAKRETWPEEGYPLEFPKSPIRVESYAYDPTDLDDAYDWAGVFGIDKLSKADQAAARLRATQEMDDLGLDLPVTDADFEDAMSSPFIQGKPDAPCLNPECQNRNVQSSLKTIALMPGEPVQDIHMFGEWGDMVLLIFQICPKCHTIRVSHQCD